MNRSIPALLAAAILFASPLAGARSYTPHLDAFYDGKNGVVDVSSFRKYAEELGTAIAPRFVGPASTLGSMGYEISLGVGMTDIRSGETYWKGDAANNRPGSAEDPGSLLVMNQIRIRKGLPYSFQIGGLVSHLYQSDLWGIGLEVGWALNEGFKYFPDFGVFTSVNTILGGGDFLMLQVATSVVLSKSFGVAGLFSLCPFGGYQMTYMNASTHLTAAYPDDSGQAVPFAINQEHIFTHRGVLGLNMVATYVTAGFEFTVGATQRSYAFKLGTIF